MDSIEDFDTLYKDMFFWETESTTENFHTFCLVPNFNHNFELVETASTDNNVDNSIFPDYGKIDNDGGVLNYDGVWNQISGFNTTDAFDSIQWGSPIYSTDTNHNVIANLKEIYIIQDVLILDYPNQQFYADIAGRTYNENLITNANTILKDILQDELLYNGNINETNTNIQTEWQYAFTLNEQKEAKQVFESMFKSSLLIPSFDSAGQFKFIGIKQLMDYSDVVSINTEDVIKYTFSLTKLDDVYNSVNIKYKKNYGSGEYDEQTGYTIADTTYTTLDEYTTTELGYSGNNVYDINYYGLDSEDAKLEVETEYIRDKYTAARLQKRLLLWYANQHLITKIDLPLSYMHLEAGDYIKYSDLLGGKLAFGYDYSKVEHRNGQLIYPVFFITKVSKSLSKVSIEAVQVHRGEYGFQGLEEDTEPDSEDTGDIVNGNGDNVTENNQLPDPQDDPNYSEDSIGTDEYTYEADDFLTLSLPVNTILNNGQVLTYITTNMDETWEYNIWAKNISDTFTYNGIDYNAEEDIPLGEVDASDLVNVALNMNGNNAILIIEKKFELNPENTQIEFVIEVKNTADYQDEAYFTQFGINEDNILLGDLNNDLTLNVLDVVRLVDIIIGAGSPSTDYEEIAGDLNQDNVYNVQDVLILINQILG